MMELIDKLKQQLFEEKLLGYQSHKKMLPQGRKYLNKKEGFTESAVNLITYFDDNKLMFVLTKRADDLLHHSGQISLPGGAKDIDDSDLWETAKRETFEEIGISIDNKSFIGRLSGLVVPVSGYNVQPFVSFLDYKPVFSNNLSEVSEIIEVEFNEFFGRKIYEKSTEINNKRIIYPYYKYKNYEIWGLTAMILAEFGDIIHSLND